MWQSFSRIGAGFMNALPRFLTGIAVFIIAILIGRVAKAIVRKSASARGEHGSVQRALGRLVLAAAVLIGLLVGVTIAFPTFTPSDMVGALGIGSVAAGFAFKDIFQNFLAGVLLLITKPFVVGDQIEYADYEGNIEDIQTRATWIKTYDGRRVVIPNAELFINPVTVNTAFPKRRMEYDIGIGYDDDIDEAKRIILEVMREAEGVAPDPQADVITVKLDPSTVNLRARWWSDSRIADVLIAQDRVLSTVKRRLQDAGIDLPYPTRHVLLDDRRDEAS
jgi:small conductance mechanosensitive channel